MAGTLPIVDLSPFRTGDAAVRARVAAEFGRICETIGFFVLTGHGMPAALGESLHREAHRFFALPLEEKLRIRRPRNDQNRAYIPYGEETLVRMHGGDSPPDIKEIFAIGPIDVDPADPYYTGPESYPSFAENLWPQRPATLRPAMEAYWRGMEPVMRLVAGAFAVALDLPTDFFADKLDKHTSQLRLLHYPPIADEVQAGQLRAGVHTDLGMMTLIRNEPVAGGLQVQTRDGDWIDAPARPDSFVVNIGDLLMRWSNDRFRSTPHRVVVPPREAGDRADRLSIGFFVGPNYDAMVKCLPTCAGPGRLAKYPPITVHDYRTDRFAAGAGPHRGQAA
jgi:isopenicillin N synthase-like dioxygenase